MCDIGLFLLSRVLAIFLPVETVSVTLVYLPCFCFDPSIFKSLNRNHQEIQTICYSKNFMEKGIFLLHTFLCMF